MSSSLSSFRKWLGLKIVHVNLVFSICDSWEKSDRWHGDILSLSCYFERSHRYDSG